MTRQALENQWAALRRQLLTLADRPLPTLSAHRARLSVAVAQLTAVIASVFILAAQGSWQGVSDEAPVWISIAVGIAFLRVMTVGRSLVSSTLVVDAVGTVILLAGTGGTNSDFYPLALAGAWWAALAVRDRGVLYGASFAAGYIVLVAPMAVRELAIPSAFYQPAGVLILAVLADQLAAMDRWAGELTASAASSVLDAQHRSLRRGLARALPSTEIPIRALLIAGQMGLTAIQTELIAYLMLGLTNQEIADGAGVSEAAVRYRLTRLYRALGVRGRKAAVNRARELGLGDLVTETQPQAA